LVNWIETRQAELLQQLGTRFMFAADELYLKAEKDFPALADYEDLAQLENGIGLVSLFRSQAAEVLDVAGPLRLPPISLVTGVSAASELIAFAEGLAGKCGLDLRVHVIENRFFNGDVTVTGLLTGQDILEQLAHDSLGDILMVPDVMLREGDDLFLDDVRISDLSERLQVQVEVVASDPWGIWDMLDTLTMEYGPGFDNQKENVNE
jgi:NifB/MoaA-like Fe-S oxidoreductase